MRLVLVGPPGAGKGTQAELVAADRGIPAISTGDIFRRNVSQDTQLGRTAKEFMDRGDLVPDDVTVAMVRERLAETDAANGFLLDGFPRTVPQAAELDEIVSQVAHAKLDAVIELVVDQDEVVRRLSGRRTCQSCSRIWHVEYDPHVRDETCAERECVLVQREDDREDTVRHRLEVYAEQTAPLVDYYQARGLLLKVQADGAVDEITTRVLAALRGPSSPG